MAVYARSFDSLPPRNISLVAKRGAVEKRSEVQLSLVGCDMFDGIQNPPFPGIVQDLLNETSG